MSKELAKTYDPKAIEEKLYEKWCENKYFHAEVDRSRKPFTTVMPPPNITGKLHMGHALDNTLQDILIRYKRMEGYNALWIPGTDHAAISTEVKVTNQLKEEGIDKKELGFICLSGLATGGSWLCYYKALQDGLASVVVPIDKLSIVVTIVFSYIVFHEKLSRKALFGLVLIIGGTLWMVFI